MEADRHLVAESVLNQSNLFTAEEVSDFFNGYSESYRRAKRLADRNLRRFTSKRARSRTTCWDVIKRLRRADGMGPSYLLAPFTPLLLSFFL
jgi:hypothetical protein